MKGNSVFPLPQLQEIMFSGRRRSDWPFVTTALILLTALVLTACPSSRNNIDVSQVVSQLQLERDRTGDAVRELESFCRAERLGRNFCRGMRKSYADASQEINSWVGGMQAALRLNQEPSANLGMQYEAALSKGRGLQQAASEIPRLEQIVPGPASEMDGATAEPRGGGLSPEAVLSVVKIGSELTKIATDLNEYARQASSKEGMAFAAELEGAKWPPLTSLIGPSE